MEAIWSCKSANAITGEVPSAPDVAARSTWVLRPERHGLFLPSRMCYALPHYSTR